MLEESQPHPESPHQKMLNFLAESDEVNSDVVPVDPDWPELEGQIKDYLGQAAGGH